MSTSITLQNISRHTHYPSECPPPLMILTSNNPKKTMHPQSTRIKAFHLQLQATTDLDSTPTRMEQNGTRESALPTREPTLLPARNPPPFGIFDIFPFTLLVGPLLRRGFNVGGKRAQKFRAKKGGKVERGRGPGEVVLSHNIPLEITLYLVSVIH